MKHHLNTLFVTTQGAYLAKEGQAVLVRVEKQTRLRVPLHTLGGIVCFGQIGCSPALMGLCGEAGVAISFLTEHGRFLARVQGFTPGNVLLRREQYRRADDPVAAAAIARAVVLGKIANARTVLLRGARDHPDNGDRVALDAAIVQLDRCLRDAQKTLSLDALRGVEGEAARTYFGAFNHLITAQKEEFSFHERSRRPPLDKINALLSFLYALLAHDARAACEAAGLERGSRLPPPRPAWPARARARPDGGVPPLPRRSARSLPHQPEAGAGLGLRRLPLGRDPDG
jgi:CRISP-associated protein Cas1